MRVQCTGNHRAALVVPDALAAYDRAVHADEVELIVGRTYDVFGISIGEDGEPWYLVCEQPDDPWPHLHLGAFFTIIDASIPSGWAIAVGGNAGRFAILPRVWAEDPTFMEKLVDGEPAALATFADIRAHTGALASQAAGFDTAIEVRSPAGTEPVQLTTDEAIAALEAEWTPEGGFFWNLRQGHFRQSALERALNKLTRIQVDEDSCLPRRMVSLLWYIPLFMEWQVGRVEENNGDMAAYRTAIATMTNAVQRILGVP